MLQMMVLVISAAAVMGEPLTHGSGGMLIGTIPEKIVTGADGTITNYARNVLLPLKQTDIQVEMIPGVISADVRQLFYNDSSDYIEANYVFPLPDDATISEMIITINEERVVRSVVKERKEAKKTYEKAKKAGKRTALLNRNTGNMMNMKIANLAPGDSAEVHLVYFQTAVYDNGTYRLTVPTVVAPKYVPKDILVNPEKVSPARLEGIVENEGAPRLPPGVASDHHFSFSASFSGIEVAKVTSPSHKLTVTQSDDSLQTDITLADAVIYPDRDVVIDISVKEPESLSASFLTSGSDGDYYTTAAIVPAFDCDTVEDTGPREVVFIIDTSASMSGTPLNQAKEGIVKAMRYLRPQDHFSILEFNSEFNALLTYAVADELNLESAEKLVGDLRACGGTEFLPVINHVLDQKPADGEKRVVIFLTDGQSCQEDEVLRRIMVDKTGTRFFPVSIGSSPNMSLLRKMAEMGRGTVTSIVNEKGIADAIEVLFAKLQKPVMTDIDVKLVNSVGDKIDGIIFPTVFPDVFAGMPVKCNIYHKELNDVQLILTGTTGGERKVIRCPIPSRVIGTDAVSQMFGQAVINDLNSQLLVSEGEDERKLIEEAILDTALEFQLVCKYTSRVAVEELIEKQPDGKLRYVPVPLHTPKGMLESTAMNDVEHLLTGLGLLIVAAMLLLAAVRLRGFAVCK